MTIYEITDRLHRVICYLAAASESEALEAARNDGHYRAAYAHFSIVA